VVSKAEGACISVQDEGKIGNFDGVEEEINVRFLFDRDSVGNEGECGYEVEGEVRAYSHPQGNKSYSRRRCAKP
jgi:hypothetical protein